MINITRTSLFATGILANANSLRVHSVYEKTINLMTPAGQLLALQAKGSPLSPISLITNLTPIEMGRLSLALDSTVPKAMIDIKKAAILDLSLPNLLKNEYIGSYTHCNRILDAAAAIIVNSDTNGFENIIKQTPSSIEKRNSSLILTTAYKKLANINTINMAERLPDFIGLGIGLTPSGDDFLCGALAALQLLETNNGVHCAKNISVNLNIHDLAIQLRHSISTRLENTNLISQSFLKCALQGQYSRAVIDLIDNPQDTYKNFNAFQAIGHSSGIDTICGIYYMLHMFFIK